MRHLLLPLAILLCPAAPALAQVTVDLHALDALAPAPEQPGHRPVPSPPSEPRGPVAEGAAGRSSSAARGRPAHTDPATRDRTTSDRATRDRAKTGRAAPPSPRRDQPPRSIGGRAGPTSGCTAAPCRAAAPCCGTGPAAARDVAGGSAGRCLDRAHPATHTPGKHAATARPAHRRRRRPPQPPPLQAGLRPTFCGRPVGPQPAASADLIKHLVTTAPTGDATTFNVLAYAAGESGRPLRGAPAVAGREPSPCVPP